MVCYVIFVKSPRYELQLFMSRIILSAGNDFDADPSQFIGHYSKARQLKFGFCCLRIRVTVIAI